MAETSLWAYDSLDLAACDRELLGWMLKRPAGYAATRQTISKLMGKDINWVCGRTKKLLDVDAMELGAAVMGDKGRMCETVKLKNAAGQMHALARSVDDDQADNGNRPVPRSDAALTRNTAALCEARPVTTSASAAPYVAIIPAIFGHKSISVATARLLIQDKANAYYEEARRVIEMGEHIIWS